MAAAQVAGADFPARRSPFWFAVWIAAVAGLLPQVRYRTDQLDAVGNTTAAIGKGCD